MDIAMVVQAVFKWSEIPAVWMKFDDKILDFFNTTRSTPNTNRINNNAVVVIVVVWSVIVNVVVV